MTTMVESCPKCGYAEVETDECPRCRVIISKYRAYLGRLGQRPPAPIQPTGPAVGPPVTPVEGGPWPEGNPAGFWIRYAALMVDSLVLSVAMFPFQLLVVVPTLLVGGISQGLDPNRTVAVNTAYNVVVLFAYLGYYVWMHGRWGQTLGKVATGVKVVQVNGEPIGYGRAFGRLLATLLTFLTFGIGYLIAAFRSDKRTLHDLVAGTRVMKVRRPWLEGKPSGFWMRYVAVSLDGYALGIPLAMLFGVVAAVAVPLTMAAGVSRSGMVAVMVTLGLFLFAAMIAYYVWMHGRWGQTLGKMALGMKVVRVDGSPLGYGGALLRLVSSVLSTLSFMIGYIIAGFRSDKRSLHDLVAGTRVTYIR